MQIAPLLHVGRGVTAIIGGGGKTTLMETLAGELSKKGTPSNWEDTLEEWYELQAARGLTA